MAIKLTTARQASIENGLKCLVHGPSGVGKTSLARTLRNAVIVSSEKGLLSLRDTDIPVIQIDCWFDLVEAYSFLTKDGRANAFEWIVLDSISDIAEVCLAGEKKESSDPRRAYGATQDQVFDMIRKFRDLSGKNVLFIAKQDRIKDEQSGAFLYQPSLPGQRLGQGIAYFFDEVFAMRLVTNSEGQVVRAFQTGRDLQYDAKDRSGALAMFEEPNLEVIRQKILSGVKLPAANQPVEQAPAEVAA